MINRKICVKCGKTKRTVKRPLCSQCYIDKNFIIWEGHSPEDIEELAIDVNNWLIIQFDINGGWTDLFGLGDIIDLHWEIFHREYVYEILPIDKQFTAMLKDIKKFRDTNFFTRN